MTKLRSAANRLRLFHHSIDRLVDQATREADAIGRPIPCKAGCAACCRVQVSVSLLEAVMLLQPILEDAEARADFMIRIVPRLRIQTRILSEENFTPLEWRRRRLPCALLDPVTQKCLRYNDRPAVCRAHIVLNPPEHCSEIGTPVQVVNIGPALRRSRELSTSLGEDCDLLLGHMSVMPIALDLAGTLLEQGPEACRKKIELNA